jgi:hypothetical protein
VTSVTVTGRASLGVRGWLPSAAASLHPAWPVPTSTAATTSPHPILLRNT